MVYYRLLALSFDEDQPQSSSKGPLFYQLVFIVFVSIFIAFSIKAVGALLLGSLIVIPISASIKIAKSFKQSLIISVIISEVSVLLGLILSYQFDLPTGAVIVLVNIAVLLVTLLKEKK
jgi:zinc transport system permease protein